jgi:hypothetical protein
MEILKRINKKFMFKITNSGNYYEQMKMNLTNKKKLNKNYFKSKNYKKIKVIQTLNRNPKKRLVF